MKASLVLILSTLVHEQVAASRQPAMMRPEPKEPEAVMMSQLPAAAGGDRTVSKVVKLLEDMLAQSKDDGERDRDLYAKFKCYCDDNEEEKKKENEELTTQIATLESEIEEIQGSTGGLSSDCAQLKSDMAENEEARATAESLRSKEHENFVAEEEDLTMAASSMKAAIQTLAEVGSDQTLQAGADHAQFMARGGSFLGMRSRVKDALSAASVFLPAEQKAKVESLLQAPFTGTYTAQSGEVVGILKNMRDTFKANLETARSDEKNAAKAHEKMMDTKLEAFNEMSSMHDKKQASLGTNDGDLASKKTQLEAARKQKDMNTEFLVELIPTCEKKGADYKKRTTLRAGEEAAVSEAIAILNNDQASSTFGQVSATSTGSTGLGFLQTVQRHLNADADAGWRPAKLRMMKFLQKEVGAQQSLRLARLVAMLEADNPFKTVLGEIKKMHKVIKKEGEADQDNFDWCSEERTTNNHALDEKTAQITSLTNALEMLEETINAAESGLKAQLKSSEANLVENRENQKTSTEDRTEENIAYQKDIRNLVAAQDTLGRAMRVLQKYYEELDQPTDEDEREAAREMEGTPQTWEKGSYKGQSKAGANVLSMLQFVLDESAKEETTAHSDEQEAQAAFEDSMADMKEQEKTLEESIAKLRSSLAEKEKTLFEKSKDKKDTVADKEAVEAYLLKIKPGCDFITKNLDDRHTKRTAEAKALDKAVRLLKGTPAYKASVAAASVEALGGCKEPCEAHGLQNVKCKACQAEVTVPGFCAGHPDTDGC